MEKEEKKKKKDKKKDDYEAGLENLIWYVICYHP